MKCSAGMVAVLLLAGCGGGGSSDSGNSGGEERRLMPLSQATASIASASMDFSQYPTELGILAVSGVNIFLITIETQPASTGVVALEPFDSRS